MGSADEPMAIRRTAARGLSAALAALLAALLASCAAVVPTPPPEDASATTSGAAADAPVFTLDPTHTFVHWEVLHMGTSTIRGRFDKANGNVRFDPKAKLLDVNIRIETASVNSGVAPLDTLLRGSAMLDVAASPQATFVAHAARFEGDIPREVSGEFTLRGTTLPLTLRNLRWKCGLNLLFRREVCGGDFEAEFDRSAFGIRHSLPFVADRVRLLIQVEAIAP
jgi:polyisoprenoid-binding protein YceI